MCVCVSVSCLSSPHRAKLKSCCDWHSNLELCKLADDWLPSGPAQTASATGPSVCLRVCARARVYLQASLIFTAGSVLYLIIAPGFLLDVFAWSNFRQLMPYSVLTNRSPIHSTPSWDRGFGDGVAVLTGVKRARARWPPCMWISPFKPAHLWKRNKKAIFVRIQIMLSESWKSIFSFILL